MRYRGILILLFIASTANAQSGAFWKEVARRKIPVGSSTIPGLVAWYYASTEYMQSSSGSITNWVDRSGSARNAWQTNTALMPTIVTSAANGKLAANFNSDILYMPSPLHTTNATFVMIYNKVNNNPICPFGTPFANCYPLAATLNGVRYINLTGTYKTLSAITNGLYCTIVMVATNTITAWENGATIPVTDGTSQTCTRRLDWIGDIGIGTYKQYGDVYEIQAYNRVLTTSECAQVGAAANAAWSTPN